MTAASHVSYIIINWNSKNDLSPCIKSILNQTIKPDEIIIIDNNSTDGSVMLLQQLKKSYPRINIIFNSNNNGYCKAANQGLALAKGEFVVLMNPDITLDERYSEFALNAMADSDIGTVAAKLLNPTDKKTFDSCGLFLDPFRRAYDRGQLSWDNGQYNQIQTVFAAPGGAAFHRMTMLKEIAIAGEILDEDFFAYYDDLDIGWRSNLAGWKCIYEPRAIAYHARGGENTIRHRKDKTPSLFAQKLSVCNRYLLLIKNDSIQNLLRHSHYILGYEVIRFFYILFKYPQVLKGIADAVKLMPKMLKKRKLSKQFCKVKQSTIRHLIRFRPKK
jgi:GT2 family glycosyltransferase